MVKEAKIRIDQEKKMVIAVENANVGEDNLEMPTSVYVESAKNALASGCPAWIVINGKKYRI